MHASEHPAIFVSAAEPSADLHGASLVREIRARRPEAHVEGVAGPRMAAAGCRQVFDMTGHAAMLLNAAGAAGKAWHMLKTAEDRFLARPFDALVVIDSPTVHLPLAERAHRLGIPVLYYIAPQLWAWGRHRIYKLRHVIRQVAAILPFEEAYFRSQGVNATFVGHPLIDDIRVHPADPDTVQTLRQGESPLIALLPGSRRHVVEQVLPGQVEVATRIARSVPNARFAVSVAGDSVADLVAHVSGTAAIPIRPVRGQDHRALVAAADLALVASGTTTLEVAFHRTPMVVMYNASRVMYQLLGRWIVRIPHLSLPNILAGRRIVPEYMPYYRSTAPIARDAIELLTHPERAEAMRRDLDDIVVPLEQGNASANTADMLLDMIGDGH